MKSLKEMTASTDVLYVHDVCCEQENSKSWFSKSTGREVDRAVAACKNGHVACVRYWHKGDAQSAHLMQVATKYDRIHVVALLFELNAPRRAELAGAALKAAAKYGRPVILKWALNYKPLDYHTLNDATALAALRGNLACFESCLEYRPALCVSSAIKGKNSDILAATLERVKADARDFALAAKMGSVRAMECMLRYGSEWDEATPAAASRWGNLECLRFAHENGCRWSSTTLATIHQDCLDYAAKHKCGSSTEKCLCVAKKRKFRETGSFFKVQAKQKSDSEEEEEEDEVTTRDLVSDPIVTNVARRAALFEMLVTAPVLPRAVDECLDHVKPSCRILTIMNFLKGAVGDEAVQPTKMSTRVQEFVDFEESEGRAFEEEFQTPLPDIEDCVSMFWSENAFVIKLVKDLDRRPVTEDHRVCWFPVGDTVYVRDQRHSFHGTIERSKFLATPQTHDPLGVFACFVFQRPLEQVCIIFSEREYKYQAAPPKLAKKCKSMQDMFVCTANCASPVQLDPPSFETLFVVFLRKNNIAVSRTLVETCANSDVWRAPGGQYGVDQFVLKNATLYDTRNRMSAPVQDLLRVLKKVPDKALFALYLFSLPLVELNDVFRALNANVRSDLVDLSNITAVREIDYCRRAIL